MFKILVLDSETTGLKEPIQPIEVAYLGISYPNLEVESEFCQRYKPDKPIELGAMATSHILLSELQNEPSYTTFKLPEDTEYLIGHNIDYDWKVIGSPNVKRIDTKAISDYLYPELDSHTQSAMIYYFYNHEATSMLKEAHNALCDVQNCLTLLACLVDNDNVPASALESIEGLYQFSELCRIPKTIAFGKFKGMPYTALDQGYVSWWLYKSDIKPTEYQLKALKLAGFRV
jgi:exodeoxyribonuclease X